ncbi:MAG: CDP-glycerol glycerophosphotransferase family protein [Clostridiales Family XIII bacterium]|nr:CDP-glycerol glycerophosphotransferase family protein [Clostridiales Family XIII bacterium]
MNSIVNILIPVLTAFMRLLYRIMKFGRVNPRSVVFLSRQSDEPSSDFKALIRALGSSAETVTLTKRQEKSGAGLLKNAPKDLCMLLRQMKAIARAAVVVTDGYSLPVSCLRHREELTVIQIWHAIGAIKKFGLQTLENPLAPESVRKRNRLLHMHEGYRFAVAPSKRTAGFFAEAFGLEAGSVLVTGTPFLDHLHSANQAGPDETTRSAVFAAHPALARAAGEGKHIILYLPTYREHRHTEWSGLAAALDQGAFRLAVKLHPIEAGAANAAGSDAADGAVLLGSEFSAEELLCVADAVVTDYSNVAFSAALSGIPLFFYLSDGAEYREYPGLNIDIETEYAAYAASDAAKLARIIADAFNDGYDAPYEAAFASRYIETFDGRCTGRLRDLILSSLR